MSLNMSIVNDLTAKLWSSFMPRRMELENRIGQDLISLQMYPRGYHDQFNPAVVFEKWALVEVATIEPIPKGIDVFIIEGGQYAVFDYKGIHTDSRIFEYIYGKWLPKSEYVLDDRPHFEVLGATYKNNDPNSEEEIWIPIKKA